MTVREIMTHDYVGVSESDAVAAAVELMLEEGVLGAVVLRGSDPVGMLTAADALSVVAEDADPVSTRVEEVMSGTVPTVVPDASVSQAAGTMADTGVQCLLVTDGDLRGLVTERDVVTATASLADRVAIDEPRTPEAAATEATAEATGDAATDPEYSSQSVCEICGSLTPDLQNFNGQLICENCRDV